MSHNLTVSDLGMMKNHINFINPQKGNLFATYLHNLFPKSNSHNLQYLNTNHKYCYMIKAEINKQSGKNK